MKVKFISLLKKANHYLRRVGDLRLLRSSGLFDEAWYLDHNPDVAQAKVDPLLHYLRFGGFEGRDPGPNFSSAWYLDTYEDVKKAGLNPLVHYLKHGRDEGRHPNLENIDIALIRSSGLFDENWYLAHNPDVAQAKVDPLLHYLRNGGFEGRDPGPNFWSAWYLEAYEGLKEVGINPLVHYLKRGNEGLMEATQGNQSKISQSHTGASGTVATVSRETFNMFWHGDHLSPLELSCMQSFLEHGHTLRVFTYHTVQLPKGAINEDAGQILSYEQFFIFMDSPSAFSNIFRYKLLYEQGGWWVDTDIVCLRSWFPFCEYFWVEEDPGIINGSVLKFPVADLRCERLLQLSMERRKNLTKWGQLGPYLLSEVLATEKPSNHSGSTHDVYPIHYLETHFFWLPEFAAVVEIRSSNSLFLHLWNKMFDAMGIDLNCTPPKGSFLRMLYLTHGQTLPIKPEDALVTRRSIARFLNQEWTVKELSDRLGKNISATIPRNF